MKRVLILLAAISLIATLTSCKSVHGVFAASNGIVACLHSTIDAAGRNQPIAHGGSGIKAASCDGDAIPGYIGVRVRLWLVKFAGETPLRWACDDTGMVQVYPSSGITIETLGPHNLGAQEACKESDPGDRFQAQVQALAVINNVTYTSAWTWSPLEAWTLPGTSATEPPEEEWIEVELRA